MALLDAAERPPNEDEDEAVLARLHSQERARRLAGHIALVGFMGAGKSSTGRIVAARLGRPFFDTDQVAEQRSGRTIPDFFAAGDERAFRALEAAVVRELAGHPEPVVLALGGGALEDPETRALLARRCLVVHLFVPWPAVRSSLRSLRSGRPLLRGRPVADIHELYLRRQRTYRHAHVRIQSPRGSAAAAADDLLARLWAGSPPLPGADARGRGAQ